MSENIPSGSNAPPPPLHHKKSKRKYDKTKLPTPPPDPSSGDQPSSPKKCDREEFLAYLDTLQKSNLAYSRQTSAAFAPVIATEDAFDHLEKLYKLMEQMLELREQNAKLHRKIRDLEHLNNLEKMHKQLERVVQENCPELDKDTAFAETILESILSEVKTPLKAKPSASRRLKQSIYRRNRCTSGSVSEKSTNHFDTSDSADRRRSYVVDGGTKSSSKVSKWTKVKAAFKWEKASPNVSDAKSQDSGLGGMIPVNLEVARYLRVPSTCEDACGHSPADSGAAEISTPATLSSASSTEDFHHRHDLRNNNNNPCEDLIIRSSDDEQSHNNIPHSKNGSQKSNKSHKTPWAKMKDIIQTRNSFKKKHRLSGHSEDIQIDVELCSDNEEVFEDDNYVKTSNDLPPEIVRRYQQVSAAEDLDNKKISKWLKVKKAFLPPHEPCALNNEEAVKDDAKLIQEEIQHNYKLLQKKLSLEFQEKLSEWERIKQHSPNASNPSTSAGDDWQKNKSQPSTKTRQNLQLASEENLPPEFRKKMQEWEKIRKTSGKDNTSKRKLGDAPRWKSMTGPRSDNSPVFEYSQLSEDFRKKIEEWKQIKSGASSVTSDDHDKSRKDFKVSPKLAQKNVSPKHSKKHKDNHEKELQWFEKELSKIDKEKQRLERERQKFLEREETLAKLRSSVVGGLKKEVLIHTPCGFYRFEGISRKFTQKLYEWEKAQGIGPESSTFALLSSHLAQEKPNYKMPEHSSSLTRSKSADSIAISALNLTCPLLKSQPSSLSLNDVDELEKECMADSKSSSMHYLAQSHESVALDEPEALIVEIEDIVEETAAPLRTFAEKTQQPIYQRQELKAMCEGETCVAPKIQRSESARAQNNYNLIEEIFSILKNLLDNELEIQKTQDLIMELAPRSKSNSELIRLMMFDESQKAMSNRLLTKVVRLQEANSNVFTSLSREYADFSLKQIEEMLEVVQDLSAEIYQLAEKVDLELNNRNVYDNNTKELVGACSLNIVTDLAREIRKKMLDLRRNLSYICAVSDVTAPKRRHSSVKKTPVKKTTSNESTSSKSATSKTHLEGRLYVKSDKSNVESQGAIKKRIKYRQKTEQSRQINSDSDDDLSDRTYPRKSHERVRALSESSVKQVTAEEVLVDDSIVQKVVVPTQTNFLTAPIEETVAKATDSPVTVFVKTTRKLFTPFVEIGLAAEKFKETPPEVVITTSKSEENLDEKTKEKEQVSVVNEPVTHLPPLPSSPTPQRKVMKDISPSIRLMLAKYNQKLSEQELPSGKSGGSSGSNSPVAWRSPSAERRVKAQTERYQEELNKLSPLLGGRREVQKSASVGFIHGTNKQITIHKDKEEIASNARNICKSLSVSAMQSKAPEKAVQTKKLPPPIEAATSSEARLKKLQKAKEEFFKTTSPSTLVPIKSNTETNVKYPARNRLSQISVDSSESSFDATFAGALMKSASAGMINVDVDVYRQFEPEVHGGGYVSLPRSTKPTKEGLLSGKFAFANIASKFRKVKMRRGKDNKESSKKMNTVSRLCRQSLVVDINSSDVTANSSGRVSDAKNEEEDESATGSSSSSSAMRSGSWIRRSKLFKK